MQILSRPSATKLLIIAHDLAMTALAVLAALALRFDTETFSEKLGVLLPLLPGFLLLALAVYSYFQLYKGKWRFASMPDIIMIAKAVGVLCLLVIVAEFLALHLWLKGEYVIGRRLVITYWLVQSLMLAGPRLIYRYWKDRYRRTPQSESDAPVLLLGRGTEVEPIIRALETDKHARLRPVGILSPRRSDMAQGIRGVPVIGTLDHLEDVVREARVAGRPIRRLIATHSALESDPEKLAADSRRLGLALARFEGVGASGAALGSVEIEDLLTRQPVDLDRSILEAVIRDRVVVVTGGGGSIGLEICRSCLRLGAERVVILENSEPAIYNALESLSPGTPDPRILAHLCDIRDGSRLRSLLADAAPHVIFHAAALKHVPYLEQDWEEGISTNTLGSMVVAEAAIAVGARILVMISTDKAVEPVSVLGASKRAAEIAVEALDAAEAGSRGRTRLISVRFGNVLGSSGSVIPRFKAQIARGGPVTVTDRDMVRYFMTLSEAADLVVVAAAHAIRDRGEERAGVYVLRMGQPVRIYELAERMIRLSGLVPHKDIRIDITGVRPGERLNEMLFSNQEALKDIGIDGVMAARTVALPLADVRHWLDRLNRAALKRDREEALSILAEQIGDFRPAPAVPSLAKPAPPAPLAATLAGAETSARPPKAPAGARAGRGARSS
jgi:O-antigen biosynthesis protein WbqV